MTMTIEEIISAFETGGKVYQREALDAALAQREAIIPELVKIIEGAKAAPDIYIENLDNMALTYAVMLVGHLNVTESHQAMCELLSIPQDANNIVDGLLEDIITSDVEHILYRTCDGSVELIKQLIANPEAYEYCRGA
ncbi:DUF1186 domain-containing protein, partial [Anaerolineales bacterium HSG24]|nr:DUF1186 domain-containing protein [Anaerolineales bacterium HSG24]